MGRGDAKQYHVEKVHETFAAAVAAVKSLEMFEGTGTANLKAITISGNIRRTHYFKCRSCAIVARIREDVNGQGTFEIAGDGTAVHNCLAEAVHVTQGRRGLTSSQKEWFATGLFKI